MVLTTSVVAELIEDAQDEFDAVAVALAAAPGEHARARALVAQAEVGQRPEGMLLHAAVADDLRRAAVEEAVHRHRLEDATDVAALTRLLHDLKLVDVALASLREQYNVDDDRIYATGFSNGGMFTYLLWAERAEVFAAYAPVAARLRPSVRPEQPSPLLHVAGEQDRVVSFADQQDAIETAIEVNGVADETAQCGEGCTVYGSDTLAPVVTWIHRGAHTYPRGTVEAITSFFRDHSRGR